MTGFWPTFLGGVAAGAVILLVGIFVRSLVQKRSQSGTEFRLNTRQLGQIVVVVVGGVMVVTGALTRQGELDPLAFMLILGGLMVIITGALFMGQSR